MAISSRTTIPEILFIVRMIDEYMPDYADRFALRKYVNNYGFAKETLLPPLRLPSQIQIVLYRNLPSASSIIDVHPIGIELEASIATIYVETLEKINKKQLKDLMENVEEMHMVEKSSYPFYIYTLNLRENAIQVPRPGYCWTAYHWQDTLSEHTIELFVYYIKSCSSNLQQ